MRRQSSVCTGWLPEQPLRRLAPRNWLTPALLTTVLFAGIEVAFAAPPESAVPVLDPEASHSLPPLATDGRSQGFAYSFSGTDTHRRASFGEPAAPSTSLARQFGLGREIAAGEAGAFSLGGAVDFARGTLATTEGLIDGRYSRLDLGSQFGYRSDPHSRIAAEVLGSYFWTRRHWIGRTFVGWRTSEGWAVGPEAWRMGESFSRCSGAGLAVRDLRLAPFRIGLRMGVETRSALGRRYIASFELSWGNP